MVRVLWIVNHFILQPIQALEHPKFQEMIDIAARATTGVNIPSRKVTRTTIKQMLKDHIIGLRARLNVSNGIALRLVIDVFSSC
jgi:hypothetical protein